MKRVAAAVIASILIFSAACAEKMFLIEPGFGDFQYIVGESGTVYYGTMDVLSTLSADDGLFCESTGEYAENGTDIVYRYRLITGEGRPLTEFSEEMYFEYLPINGTIRMYKDGYVGVLDKDGTFLVPCAFECIREVAEGRYFAVGTADADGYYPIYVVETDPFRAIPTEAVCDGWISEASCGPVLAKDKKSGHTGFIGTDGSWAVQPVYSPDMFSVFAGGHAAVTVDGINFGFIDTDGNRITELKYTLFDVSDDGSMALCFEPGKPFKLINLGTGDVIRKYDSQGEWPFIMPNGFVQISGDDGTEIFDRDGKRVSDSIWGWNFYSGSGEKNTEECVCCMYGSDVGDQYICGSNGNVISGPYSYAEYVGTYCGKTLYRIYDPEAGRTYIIDSGGERVFGNGCSSATVLDGTHILTEMYDGCEMLNGDGDVVFRLSAYTELID